MVNASYSSNYRADHTYTVHVVGGIPSDCTCPAWQYCQGACKHMVRVALSPGVIEAAAIPPDPDGPARLPDGGAATKRDTVVTVEPASVHVELIDGRVAMVVATRDAQIHVRRPEHPPTTANDPALSLVVAGADGDLAATVEFTRVDIEALTEAFCRTLGGGEGS